MTLVLSFPLFYPVNLLLLFRFAAKVLRLFVGCHNSPSPVRQASTPNKMIRSGNLPPVGSNMPCGTLPLLGQDIP